MTAKKIIVEFGISDLKVGNFLGDKRTRKTDKRLKHKYDYKRFAKQVRRDIEIEIIKSLHLRWIGLEPK